MRLNRFSILSLLCLLITVVPLTAFAQDLTPADIVDDEGGVQIVTGEFAYTIPDLADYGTQPLIFLGDISEVFGGEFVFSTEYLNVDSPQFLGTITSDIRQSPFTFEVRLPIAPGGMLADVDNDGDVDLVTSNVVDGTLGVLLNNGSGGFPGLKVVALGVTPGRPATAHGYAEDEIQEVETLVDLNGDLLADVVVIDADAGRILYLLSMGDGTFDDAIEVDTTGAWPVALSLGEANNDGFPDLLVAYADGSGASFFNKGESGVGFFEVDGLDAGQTPVDMIAPDRDFDGDNDLAVVDADGYVSILLNPSTLFEYYRYTLNRCRI